MKNISERGLPPPFTEGDQERTADVLVTLDTLTSDGGPGDSENKEYYNILAPNICIKVL